MTTTTTITLAVPTPFAVDPARLVAWLAAHHWTVVHGDEHCKMWMRTAPSGMSGHICLFNDLSHPHWREGMASTVTIVARTEGLEPHDLAALLASPRAALAWIWPEHSGPEPMPIVGIVRTSDTRAARSAGMTSRTTAQAPAASSASAFAAAVPDEPDTMAPAWPIVLPSGAVNPAT